MNLTKRATELFKEGYSCSQAVLGAFAPALGMDMQQALQISACFGRGMRCGSVCGACTGALMVLGMQYAADPKAHDLTNRLATEFLSRFEQENGATLCKVLLDKAPKTEADPAAARLKGPCPGLVASAVKITEELIAEYGFPQIRPAKPDDASRITEIIITNYRKQFYPVFRSDEYYFQELNTAEKAAQLRADKKMLKQYFVYDDGIVRGCIRISGTEIVRLFVEPSFQNRGIGAKLLAFADTVQHTDHLWVLECNPGAIRFYERHGYRLTDTKKPEPDTDRYLILMQREDA